MLPVLLGRQFGKLLVCPFTTAWAHCTATGLREGCQHTRRRDGAHQPAAQECMSHALRFTHACGCNVPCPFPAGWLRRSVLPVSTRSGPCSCRRRHSSPLKRQSITRCTTGCVCRETGSCKVLPCLFTQPPGCQDAEFIVHSKGEVHACAGVAGLRLHFDLPQATLCCFGLHVNACRS